MSETIITKDLLDKMVRLRNQAEYFDLVGVELLREMTATEMAQVCNGIGSADMPKEWREALDRLHPDLVVVSAIHDAMFEFMPCKAFSWVNKSLKENGYRIADAKYRWFNLRRYIVRASARAFRTVCNSEVGVCAFFNAHSQARKLFDPDRLKHLQKIAIDIWQKHK